MSSSSGSSSSGDAGERCPDITKYNGCTRPNCPFDHPLPDLSQCGVYARDVGGNLIQKFGDRKCQRKQSLGFLSEEFIGQIASCPAHSKQKLEQENTDESLCDLTCSDPTCNFHVEVKLAAIGTISGTVTIKVNRDTSKFDELQEIYREGDEETIKEKIPTFVVVILNKTEMCAYVRPDKAFYNKVFRDPKGVKDHDTIFPIDFFQDRHMVWKKLQSELLQKTDIEDINEGKLCVLPYPLGKTIPRVKAAPAGSRLCRDGKKCKNKHCIFYHPERGGAGDAA